MRNGILERQIIQKNKIGFAQKNALQVQYSLQGKTFLYDVFKSQLKSSS